MDYCIVCPIAGRSGSYPVVPWFVDGLSIMSQLILALLRAGVQVHWNGYMDSVNPGGQGARVRLMLTEWCQYLYSSGANLYTPLR